MVKGHILTDGDDGTDRDTVLVSRAQHCAFLGPQLSRVLSESRCYPHSTDGETEALTRCHMSKATG